MTQTLALIPSFVLAIGYFRYHDLFDSKVSYLYYKRGWKFLGFLVDSIYFSTFVGVITAGITIAIVRASGESPTIFYYSGAGLFMGSLMYWWLHPDRTSPHFGGGTFFLYGILIHLALILLGFLVALFVYWLTLNIFP